MSSVNTTWFLFGRQTEIPDEFGDSTNFGYCRFYYVREGTCYFCDNKEKVLLEKGYVYLLPRKAYSLSYGDERRFDHIWGHFQIEGWQFNNIIKVSLPDDPVFLDFISLIEHLSSIFFVPPKKFENQTDMMNLFSDDPSFEMTADVFSAFVNYIYLHIYEATVYKCPLDGIIDYINDNLDRDLSNDTLAEIAQYSKAHFIQEFSRIHNISPQKYVIKARMSQAITMLMNNEKIYNISYKVGYDNPKSFARAFKRETGLTPQDYRTIHYLNIHNIR